MATKKANTTTDTIDYPFEAVETALSIIEMCSKAIGWGGGELSKRDAELLMQAVGAAGLHVGKIITEIGCDELMRAEGVLWSVEHALMGYVMGDDQEAPPTCRLHILLEYARKQVSEFHEEELPARRALAQHTQTMRPHGDGGAVQ
ncbi:hypothetical protein [Rubrivivax gelatinosus]|uniref:hypothetical protein n=1 Tax=Rubrivivax gelatinosus TaxID=28068 RepID=UPI0005C224A0|nr:hypothetical protein [Rubrivivax gelatinosus]MBG6082721.1 hypothetical protein [Rubrivivax gelatinosus]